MGCAGDPRYIAVFRRHVRRAFKEQGERIDYESALNEAIDSYGVYLRNKIESQGLNKMYSFDEMAQWWPQGILAVYDKSRLEYRVIQFDAPHPCIENSLFPRAAVGTGGVAAMVFIKTAEEFMANAQID